jgi:ABC-2 type transport system permease protein
MSTTITQTWFMTQRQLMAVLRQPAYVVITLVQPVIWLFLFGSLFRKVVELPGFGTGSYLDYLVPGVVAMTALFSSSWSGMGLIDDIDRGILDRFLASPTHRSSLIIGRLVQDGISLLVQAAVIGALARLLGAKFESGLAGYAVLVLCAVMLGASFGSLSNALALLLRQRESVIGANQFLGLPLTFMSAAFMPLALAPDWIATVARFNPLNWAVEAGREALVASPDWAYVGVRVLGLAIVAAVAAAVATRAFRTYQRSA